MGAKVVLCFLLAFICVASAQTVTKLVIDDFRAVSGPLLILVDQNDLPETVVTSTQDNGILGGERDLSLTVETGQNDLVVSSGVSNSRWNVASQQGVSGFSFIQYDGTDNSPNLDSDGLGGVDITANLAQQFRFLIESDFTTFYTLIINDMQGRTSDLVVEAIGDDIEREYIFGFDEFVGDADFTDVGSMLLEVEAFAEVDAVITFFGTVGPDPSPSPQPNPSASNSPAPPPPPGASASQTPAPSPPPGDGFTWYTFDDDDNGRSPCTDEQPRKTYFVSDDNIIYYYFFGVNDALVTTTESGSSVLAVAVVFTTALVALVL